MKVRYSRRGLLELAVLLQYIDARSPQGAKNVLRRIKQIERHIGRFPSSGARTSDGRLRKMATPPFPFLVFYEVTDADIIIHRIRHGARLPSEPT